MSTKKKQTAVLKQDINLAQTDRKGTPPKTAAAVAVCLALFVGLFCKFAVIEQLDRVWSSQRAADQAAQQLLIGAVYPTVGLCGCRGRLCHRSAEFPDQH